MKLYPALIRTFVISIAIAGFFCPRSLAAADDLADLKALVAKLQSEVETLKAEKDTLKKENQALRRIIAERQEQSVAPAERPVTVPASVQTPATQQKTSGYWITTSSGVRHNSSCRYYLNSKGRGCGPTEGRACKLCGG